MFCWSFSLRHNALFWLSLCLFWLREVFNKYSLESLCLHKIKTDWTLAWELCIVIMYDFQILQLRAWRTLVCWRLYARRNTSLFYKRLFKIKCPCKYNLHFNAGELIKRHRHFQEVKSDSINFRAKSVIRLLEKAVFLKFEALTYSDSWTRDRLTSNVSEWPWK